MVLRCAVSSGRPACFSSTSKMKEAALPSQGLAALAHLQGEDLRRVGGVQLLAGPPSPSRRPDPWWPCPEDISLATAAKSSPALRRSTTVSAPPRAPTRIWRILTWSAASGARPERSRPAPTDQQSGLDHLAILLVRQVPRLQLRLVCRLERRRDRPVETLRRLAISAFHLVGRRRSVPGQPGPAGATVSPAPACRRRC